MFTVYVIYSSKIDRFYVGQTSNLEQRLRSHREFSKGFTARADYWKLVYSEQHATRRQARIR